MKEITITVPDDCELKQNGNTYTIIEKEKKLTYDDIAKELFLDNSGFYINQHGDIISISAFNNDYIECNNCTSKRQASKLLAINKLMNVAKYLNGNWQPDWENDEEGKYYISLNHVIGILFIDCTSQFQNGDIYFKSEELALQAIEILGEETIKLVLCTDY